MRRIDVIDFVAFGKRQDIFGNQQIDVIDGIDFCAFFRLIQSQSQTGTASAKPFEHDPQDLARVLFHDLFELSSCQFCNRQHRPSSF